MLLEWCAQLCVWRRRTVPLQSLQPATLPPLVGGLLASLLPATDTLQPLRTKLATQLRQTLQPTWMEAASLAELCAVIDGLHSLEASAITGDDVAILVQRLLKAELAVGGPYGDADGSPEEITNALVNQCLSWVAEPLPNVTAFLANTQTVPADLSDITLVERSLLAALRPADSTAPLHTQQLQRHGDLFIAALLAQIATQLDTTTQASRPVATDADLAQAIYTQSLERFKITAEPFAGATNGMLRRVVTADADHEIATLAAMYGATRSLTPRRKLYEILGIANIYAWAAYTIYDDFLDEEGTPQLLGSANYTYRAMVRTYRAALPQHAAFQDFVEQTLAVVDAANTRETSLFRFDTTAGLLTIDSLPDYGDAGLLADRALFHVIGPMAVLAAEGEPVGSAAWNETLDAFRHYLIARQLNDDIHDWVDDLRAGQASYVVVAVLRYLDVPPGTYRLEELLQQARQVFWQAVLPELCDTATAHIAAARGMPQTDPELFEHSPLAHLFDTVAASMQAARQKRSFSYDLLKHFSL